MIEFIQGIPTIPLWLGFAAAVPDTWSPLHTYFAITLILSIIGWTGLARVVRGRFLSLREEEFVTAARLDGAGEMRIILRHMLPSFSSHIIASVTLAIPGIILAETALSFLGLGLRSPINSWGVLLQEAQNIRSVSTAPWLLLPGIMVIIAVISLNFLGDGLRDAADPYESMTEDSRMAIATDRTASSADTTSEDLVLEVRDLKTWFELDEGTVKALDGATFDVKRGKTLCIVGESGCGKSMTARSILQIVQPPGKVVDGEMLFHQVNPTTKARKTIDLATLDPKGDVIRGIRGKEISMIFQEPMTSFSPVHTIGDQIAENILHPPPTSRRRRRQERSIEMLRRVSVPRAADRFDAYPYQLSGGLRQRAMIAMALSNNPSLLIADEPTTALDVTTQAQILELMQNLQDELGMGMIFITHDLGVVAEIADEVAVMYLGIVVERGTVDEIFHAPKHPYTRALLQSVPRLGEATRVRLNSIRGMVPSPVQPPHRLPVQHPLRFRDPRGLRQHPAARDRPRLPARCSLPAARARIRGYRRRRSSTATARPALDGGEAIDIRLTRHRPRPARGGTVARSRQARSVFPAQGRLLPPDRRRR